MSEVIATPPASVTGSSRSASSPILCVRNIEKLFGAAGMPDSVDYLRRIQNLY